MVTGAAAAAGAMSARARRRIIAALRDQGAFSPAAAIPIAQPRTVDRNMLRALVRQGAVIEDAPGRYHLDEAMLAVVDARWRRITFAIYGGAALIVAALCLYLMYGLR